MWAVLRVAALVSVFAAIASACSSFTASDPGDADAAGAALADSAISDASRFCGDAGPSFCDDFERLNSDLAGAEWSTGVPVGPGTLEIADAPSRSYKTRALHAGAMVGALEAMHRLERPYSEKPAVLEVAFDLYVPATPSASFHVASVVFAGRDGGEASGVVVGIGATNVVRLFENSASGANYNARAGAMELGVWRRYTLRIDLTTKVARLSIEGKVADVVLDLAIPHGAPSQARVGLVYAAPQTQPADVWLDDVLIRR